VRKTKTKFFMKTRLHSLFIALALLAGVHQVAAQGTAFTHQGRLNNSTNPATGTYDLPAQAAERQILHGHVPRAVTDLKLPAIGRLPATTTLQLAIGLPLRNKEGFNNFLKDLYTPGSPNFRKYLTSPQFTEKFGPTEQDYQTLIEFARTNGLTVTCTHPNRKLLDIKASVADIERVFHVTMRLYQHPTEARTFFAPDVEPSLDLTVPVLAISGLDSYIIPHHLKLKPVAAAGVANGTRYYQGGTGPDGEYTAKDLRTAYAPSVIYTGSGQSVGLLEFSGYYANLITLYEKTNNLPTPYPTLTTVLLDGASGNPATDTNYPLAYEEVELDIEMAIAMAPGLNSVIVYELPPPPTNGYPPPPDDALNRMATDNLAKQLSSSLEYARSGNTDEIFQELAAQGQSFFQSSGDIGATTGANVSSPFDDPYVTLVGGTELTMTANGGAWSAETVWNNPSEYPYGESGGGISPTYSLPWYQEGINMSANGGSTTMRNMPDVAMVADNVVAYTAEEDISNPGEWQGWDGTSIAAPLWAGFMALANQLAAIEGLPSVGFANPAIYWTGTHAGYTEFFHDITSGNNTNSSSPAQFSATTGYDLCTGWGTPNGQGTIDALCFTLGGLVYVQFGLSNPGNGTWYTPYNTMALGVANVPTNGAILIKAPGTSAETMTISKPMTIEAVGGSATIGN
jgi:subtilase family serine protease